MFSSSCFYFNVLIFHMVFFSPFHYFNFVYIFGSSFAIAFLILFPLFFKRPSILYFFLLQSSNFSFTSFVSFIFEFCFVFVFFILFFLSHPPPFSPRSFISFLKKCCLGFILCFTNSVFPCLFCLFVGIFFQLLL